MRLRWLATLAVGGFVLAHGTGTTGVASSSLYQRMIVVLLVVGLYGSTSAINLREARRNIRIIATAITAGVVAKATLIGVVMSVAFGQPHYLLLGIVMAQIDPLSVAAMLGDSAMSGRAKTVLAAWACFDDPVTVVLAFAAITVPRRLVDGQAVAVSLPAWGAGYGADVLLSCGLAICTFVVWRVVASRVERGRILIGRILLGVVVVTAIRRLLLLAVALVGTFLRPGIHRFVTHATAVSCGALALLLGMLLSAGVHLWGAVVLGIITFLSQVVVSIPITRRLPPDDRRRLAIGQQNGVTAISLALLLESVQPGTVGLVAPAVIVVQVLHAVATRLLDTTEARRRACVCMPAGACRCPVHGRPSDEVLDRLGA